GSDSEIRRERVLLLANIDQPPFNNNLLPVVRAFERLTDLRLVQPVTLRGFVPTGAAAPAPVGPAAADGLGAFVPDSVVCVGGGLVASEELHAVLPPGTVYVGIAFSDPLGLEASVAIAPRFDLFYTHDPLSVSSYRAAGIDIRECPLAIDAEMFRPVAVPKTHDVIAVAKWTPYRDEALERIAACARVAVHTHPGETRWSVPSSPTLNTPEELCAAISRARLFLEFARVESPAPLPGRPWRITQRAMFAAACGVPALVEDDPLLPRTFEPEAEIFPFRDLDHLEARVGDLLADPERLVQVGERARARTVAEHTWDRRAAAILADVRAVRSGRL
ncbi:MAG: glycosyltransferase family protein, partial [Acidobacteriota bacterium]